MNTIIVKPKSEIEQKEVLDIRRKMKIKTELYNEPVKAQILTSIEKGAKSAATYLKGKTALKKAKDLLNEL